MSIMIDPVFAPQPFVGVDFILFWDTPMMGSTYPADDIWHPSYRQIRPFSRLGRVCALMVGARKAAGLTPFV
jgi:hypothetical protein